MKLVAFEEINLSEKRLPVHSSQHRLRAAGYGELHMDPGFISDNSRFAQADDVHRSRVPLRAHAR
jgi:hypothetical protein